MSEPHRFEGDHDIGGDSTVEQDQTVKGDHLVEQDQQVDGNQNVGGLFSINDHRHEVPWEHIDGSPLDFSDSGGREELTIDIPDWAQHIKISLKEFEADDSGLRNDPVWLRINDRDGSDDYEYYSLGDTDSNDADHIQLGNIHDTGSRSLGGVLTITHADNVRDERIQIQGPVISTADLSSSLLAGCTHFEGPVESITILSSSEGDDMRRGFAHVFGWDPYDVPGN